MHTLVERLDALGDRLVGRWPGSVLSAGEPGDVSLARQPAAVFRAIVWVALLAIAAQSVVHLLDAAVLDLRIEALDADRDASVWSWTGSSAELMAALGAALLVVLVPGRWKTLGFLMLAFTFLSMDDTVQIHERLSHLMDHFPGGPPIPRRIIWPILYAPLMLATYVLLWRVSGGMSQRCRRAARSGLILLGIAVVLEFAVSTAIIKAGYGRVHDNRRVGGMLYELEVVVEEGLELGGWLLIAAAMIATGLDLLIRQVRTGSEDIWTLRAVKRRSLEDR